MRALLDPNGIAPGTAVIVSVRDGSGQPVPLVTP
jgi:hypothetical protein